MRTQSEKSHRDKSEIADLIAEGCPSIRQAGETIGIGRSQADRLWKRICRDLGWQAR